MASASPLRAEVRRLTSSKRMAVRGYAKGKTYTARKPRRRKIRA